VLLLATAGLILWQHEELARVSGAAAVLLYLVSALVPAILLFGLFRTVARVTGKLYGLPIELGGPAALFIIVLLLLMKVAPAERENHEEKTSTTSNDATSTNTMTPETTETGPTTASGASSIANGNLQLHFLSVGDGTSSLLVSPKGETVLLDSGPPPACSTTIAYLRKLGVTRIDYHIASHYHADHIGCSGKILAALPLRVAAFDGGESYSSTIFEQYRTAVGARRRTAVAGQTITLDGNDTPVVIKFVALNGEPGATSENTLSLVTKVSFEDFDAVFGGDLTGYKRGLDRDLETSVAPQVGAVEVYSVHHHCSSVSSNPYWLATTKPRVGIISVADISRFRLPNPDCLARLHQAGVQTYWTGAGGATIPDPRYDTVAGDVAVQVEPRMHTFTISGTNRGVRPKTFRTWENERATGSRP
jgi:competence protein ComEC